MQAAEFSARVTVRGPDDARLLQRLDVSVESIRRGVADVWIDEKEEAALVEAGLRVERVVDDAFKATTLDGLAEGYHDPATCEADFKAWAEAHPDVCAFSTIGTSVQGRSIVALKITTDPANHAFKPAVRICGAHHGNEVGGSETVIKFARYLLDNYASDPRIGKLVAEREIWILPMVNPDGVARRSRYNANYKDLNRNYGYHFKGGYKAGASPFSEPETRAVRDHAAEHPFALSLSFHCSGNIVNYLWNYTGVRAPDQDLILELSEGYARTNQYEVTEGWDWYQINGDTNDWAYGSCGTIDWTIEVANPSFSQIDKVFDLNRDAMLYIVEEAGRGVEGVVTDAVTTEPLHAMVEAIPPGWPAFTHPTAGDYHRVLQPGTYTLRVWAPGYQQKSIEGVVVSTGAAATRVDVALDPAPGIYHAMNVAVALIPEDSYKNTTHGPHALGPADGRFCSLGAGGVVVLDLSPAFPAGSAAKIAVHDAAGADEFQEGFEVATAASSEGPWTVVGTGRGTATVEAPSLLRYLRVVDKSTAADGRETITPGLDLDAVTVELKPADQARRFRRLHGAP